MKRPLEVLENILKDLQGNLNKSKDAFEKGNISPDVHQTHVKNLTPLIEEYKYIIRIIETYA